MQARERVFWWSRLISCEHVSGPDAHTPSLLEKTCPDGSADRRRPTLDGKICSDCMIRTVTDNLRVGIGDALPKLSLLRKMLDLIRPCTMVLIPVYEQVLEKKKKHFTLSCNVEVPSKDATFIRWSGWGPFSLIFPVDGGLKGAVIPPSTGSKHLRGIQ